MRRLAGSATETITRIIKGKGSVVGPLDDKTNSSKATFMEGGWEKRGKGSSIKRTIEIYSFCIRIILREVKLRKVKMPSNTEPPNPLSYALGP